MLSFSVLIFKVKIIVHILLPGGGWTNQPFSDQNICDVQRVWAARENDNYLITLTAPTSKGYWEEGTRRGLHGNVCCQHYSGPYFSDEEIKPLMRSMKLVGGRAGPGIQAGPVSSSCPAGMQTTPAPARRHPGNGKLAALQVLGRPGAESCCPSPTREQSALLQLGEHSSKPKALR